MNPNETYNALDDMDEKLKRLGLNEGTSVLSGYTAEQSQQYLQSIRDIKKERDKTQKEKAYRAYMLNEGEEKGDKYLSDVKQAKNRQAIIDNASHVLRGETEKAAAISRNRELRASEEQEREKQLKKEAALRESMLKREQEANAASRSAMTDSTSVSNRTDDATTEEFCRNLARGVINLSMLVSDNRHLPSTDTFGNRVRSEHENLEVTQWRTWVRECLYGATQPQEKQRSIDETPVQEEAPPAESSSPLENEAEELLRYVAELQEGYSEQAVGKTTSKGLSMMNELVEILRKEKLDTLRREHEAELGEEVVPRWTQRLPPAGCFVHGGELSGTHLLRDTIENVHETNTRQNSTPPTAGATNTSRAGVCVRSGEAQHLFVTPRTLLNAGVPQTTAKGGASTAGSKAKKGLRSSLNFTEEDEKKDWEQLFEMVCKELIHAYWNNLSVISENDVPPPPSNTADGAAGKHARGLQESVLASDLITVHLVGFPETKEFYQSLLARLSTLLETTQVDILAAIDRKRNDDRLDSSPPNKPKQSVAKATVGKGKKSVQANVAPQESPAARVQPKVLPPVCLLGFFLHHDLPTGLQRLQECSPNPGNVSFPYFHDVFFPDTKVQPPTASSPFSPSATQDARNSIASSKPNNNSTMPAELVEWSRQALRSVLLQQNKKAEQWCHTWGSSLSLAAMANYQQNSALAAGGHYAGGAGKGDKVKRTGDRARTAERERRASVATSIVSSSDPSSVPQEAKPYQFPRVLFFVRKVDVSDAALQQFNKDNSFQSSEEAESAVCLYPFPSLDSSASETELERWRLVYCLTAHLVEVSDPSKMRFLSKDTLIPDQLPTGFRLNDYLFPKEVLDCMSHTAQLHNDILVKNKSLKSSPFVDDSVSVPSDFHSCCVLVEQEAFRVAYHFPLKCADMINSVRFPSEGDNRGKPKSQLFKEIDAVHHQNLQSLSSLQSQYQQKLKNSGCFVLCCAVKYSVISLARVINGVCALLVNSMAPTATAAVSGEQAPGEAFMAAAPPVTFDVVASTVAALLEQDRPLRWDGLQPFIGQVSAAATSVMEKFVLDVAEQYALSEDSKQFWVEQTQKMVQHLVADTFLWDEAATLSKFAELVTRERDGSAPGAEYPAVIAPWLARCAALLRCMGRLTEKTRLATESWLSHQYNQASSLLPQAEGTVLAGVQDLFSRPLEDGEKRENTLHLLQWETYLATLSIYGKDALSMEQLRYCHLLQQVQLLWQFSAHHTERSATLEAFSVGSTGAAEEEEVTLPEGTAPLSLWFTDHLTPQKDGYAFLTAQELDTHLAHFASDKGEINLYQWCTALLFRQGGNSEPLSPTGQELLYFMTSLPPEMNAQSVDQPHAPQLVPFLECVPRSWENAWWWGAFGGGHTYHAKALVSLMTTLFALGRDGPLRWSYPTLPRMMCVLASHPRSVYSTLEYLLYALSAFRHAAAQQFNSQALMQTVHDFFVDSDTVELSAREVAYYTRPIVHANEEEGLTLTESAQLVMQMESVESLNFTKLVSSHWGKQLIESYFA